MTGHAAAERCPFRDRSGAWCRRPRGHEPDTPHVVVDERTSRIRVYRVARAARAEPGAGP